MSWVAGLSIFAAGIGIGILIHYWGWNKSTEIKRLMRENNRLNKEHRELQTSVDDYFSTTNRLISDLNNSFEAVQSHFSDGIETLGRRAALQDGIEAPSTPTPHTPPKGQLEAPTEQTVDTDTSKKPAEEHFSPPKDYAPKSKEDEGTLSEEFGLKSSHQKKGLQSKHARA